MRLIIFLSLLFAGSIFIGCDNKEFLYRDVSARIWLGKLDTLGNLTYISDSSVISFLLLPADKETDTLYVTANVTGTTAPIDRRFKLEIVANETNVSASDYTIGEAVIPANSFTGLVPVIVKKHVQGLDLNKERALLTVRFIPNEHFLYATPDTDIFKIIWSNFLSRPASWDVVQSLLGNFSQAKYKFIIDFYGDTEFEKYRGNTNMLLGLQSVLKKALQDYNADPANIDRAEGWPYKDDDGTPLVF